MKQFQSNFILFILIYYNFMGCSAQKESICLKSLISTKPIETYEEIPNLIKCYICEENINQQIIYLEKCKHYFHSKCFIELIEKQVEINKSSIIKCKCGTKTTTNQIRQSSWPNKLILLNSLFRQQLNILLIQLRKKPDYQEIENQFNKSQQHADYYFFHNIEDLQYEETPQ
ncbi:unnamed protein product [Paramecium sonneborni]|uniref:RING-type domain-containing protein n=1 Tax=Paramecium sonneborni TaxID=65129 RepID=A0A8S1QUY6_9CILI|nr:unnamed protein product [Paramecium sonneborni]